MMVTKVESKKFISKNIKHVAVFKKKDKRTVYNMIYRDGKKGTSYIKRFSVTGVTRDKVYDLTNGNKDSKMLYFSANPNGEAEIVNVILRQTGSIKKLKWELDFADLDIKGRSSKGNIVSKYTINKIEFKEKGLSTLKPRKIWFDETIQRLNVDGRGELLGEFKSDDNLIIIQQKGSLKTVKPDVNMHFPEDMITLEKWIPKKPISVLYFNGHKDCYFVKRFIAGNQNNDQKFIPEGSKIQLELVSTDWRPVVELIFSKTSKGVRDSETKVVDQLISIKGIKAIGNKLSSFKIKNINQLDPLEYTPPEKKEINELVVDSEEIKTNGKDVIDDKGQTELEF